MAAVTQPTLRWHELPEEAWDTYFLPSSLVTHISRTAIKNKKWRLTGA